MTAFESWTAPDPDRASFRKVTLKVRRFHRPP